MEINSLSLGEKIRNYRKQREISQFNLEIKIGAAFGSISRIENNLVKPTRETLSKISKALDLTPSQTADLLGLRIFSPEELVNAINKISQSLDLEITIQTAVDIMFDLYPNYNGGTILLIEKERLFCKTASNVPRIKEALKLLPKAVYKLNISLSDEENLIVKSIKHNKNYQSYDFVDFTRHAFNDSISRIISKILHFESGISIPILINNVPLGAALYTKRVREPFSQEEIKILTLLNNQLAIAITNAKKFEQINQNGAEVSKYLNHKT